jgi:hypothetical protein
MSKLGDYLKTNKIDTRRVLSTSRSLEQRTRDDRKLVAEKALMKAGKKEKDEAVLAKKPRSGRALTAPMMSRAIAGKDVPGPVKTRIVRAVNSLLSAKKKAEIKIHDLFGKA